MRPYANASVHFCACLAMMAGCAGAPDLDPLEGSWSADPIGSVAGSTEPGAVVTTVPLGFEAVADSAGGFRIDRLPPGDYVLLGALAGATGEADAVVTEGEVAEVELDLVPEEVEDGLVEVIALGPDDAPLVGAVVTGGSATAFTDDRGIAVLTDLGGQTVRLEVHDADDRLWPRSIDDLEVPELGRVRIGLTLSGRPLESSFPVGDALCALCHPATAADHAATAHGRALTTAPGAGLQAAFDDGWSVDLGDGASATLEAGPSVAVTDRDGTRRAFAVAGFLGDGEGGAVPWTERSDAGYPLPVAWRGPDPERAGTPDGDGVLLAFQADRWLSGGVLRPAPPVDRSAEAQCFGCHTTGFELTIGGDGSVRMDAPEGGGRWVDDGVTCERCHGPGDSHRVSLPADKRFTITNPANLDPERAADVCAQCHSGMAGQGGVPFPWSATGLYTPGEVLADFADPAPVAWPHGAAAGPHSQADELAVSGHDQITGCTSCHAIHGAQESHLLRVSSTDNALCSGCHLPLTWGGSRSERRAHTGHYVYDPTGVTQSGRCTSCHMPATATDVGFSPWSGTGTLASHLLLPVPPRETLDAFDAAEVTTLQPGQYPEHGCSSCHMTNAWFWDGFPGPAGDPTERATHAAHQAGWDKLFP